MKWQDHLRLKDGETVLWEGRPVVWSHVASYLVLTVFGLGFGGGAYLLWTQPGGPHDTGYWVMLSILSFVTIAALTAPLQAWFLASRTTYVLTNLRAVVLEPGVFKRCKAESFPVDEWKLEVWGESAGAGSVSFASFGMGGRLGFKNLADMSAVEPLARRLAAESAAKRLATQRQVSQMIAPYSGWLSCWPGDGVPSDLSKPGQLPAQAGQAPAEAAAAKADFTAAFLPRAELFRTWGPVSVGSWIALVLGAGIVLLGAQLGSLWMGPGGTLLTIACAGVLVGNRIRRRRQLKCPACERLLLGAVESHCPHCGQRTLMPQDPYALKPSWLCGGCGRRIQWGDGRDFLLRHCTHCGVWLHREGLRV